MTQQAKGFFEFGPFRMDTAERLLLRDGQPVPLTPKAFETLLVLVRNSGHMLGKEELMKTVWPETFVEEGNLTQNIFLLRKALGEDPDGRRYIETIPRLGYRFVAPVKQWTEQEAGRTAPEPSPSPVAAAEQETAGLPRPRRVSRFLAALVLSVALAAVLTYLWTSSKSKEAASTTGVKSLAVLPLENLSRDPEQEYFADGMTDALITHLAKIGALRVISRTSVMGYKGTRKLLPQIARELNVDAVVEGSVQRSGERVRITAQLVHARTDQHLWAESYEGDLRDVLALQSEVARAVARQISVRLTPQEQAGLAGGRPIDPQAYEAYLKGRYFWAKNDEAGRKKSIELFQQAIEKEPHYALAYSGLSDSYRMLGFGAAEDPGDFVPKAKAAAMKALELDDTLAEAHASLAAFRYRYDWDWVNSEIEFKRALGLNPSYAEGHREYAVFLRTAGKFDEAIAEARRARELDPLALNVNLGVATAFLIARRYDQAMEQCQKTLEMEPNYAQAHFELGLAHQQKARFAEALGELEKAVSLSGRNPHYLAALGHAYGVSGKTERAQKILDELEKRSRQHYVSPYNMALTHIGLGNKEQALAWLEKAYEKRSFYLITINSWPWFDSLRSHPQFQDLVRRIGLNPKDAIPH